MKYGKPSSCGKSSAHPQDCTEGASACGRCHRDEKLLPALGEALIAGPVHRSWLCPNRSPHCSSTAILFASVEQHLDPASGASVNPITDISDLKTLGQFTYTRRVGTGLDYTIWTSTTLLANEWDEDTTADQEAGAPVDGVETVLVTLSEIPDSDKFFVRVKAN